MVSFNSIPSNLRVPFTAVEFDASRAAQGPALLAYRALLIGQKLPSAPALANSLHRVTNADAVATLTGRGSMCHRMAIAYFAGNKSTETWIGVLADNSAGVFASGSVALSGTATADGVMDLYVGGGHVQVAVASGDTASTIASSLATEIGKRSTGTVTCASAIATDTITVDGTVFTGAAGAATLGAATFSIDTDNTATAASIAAQVNAHATASTKVRASSAVGVVTLRAITGGVAGNALTLVSSTAPRLAVTAFAGASVDTDLPVHATVSGGTVTLLARNSGLHANEIDVRQNYYPESEETPAGITSTITAMASGASNPSLTALISAMGDSWFQILALPFTDTASLASIETEMTDRNSAMRQIDGMVFVAKNDTYSNVATLGNARNSSFLSIIRTQGSPTPPAEVAAHVAAVVAYYAPIDPARPTQTLPLPGIMAPAESDRDTLTERNLLLFDGISTFRVASGGVVQIERLITTYKTNAAGSPDTAYLDISTVLTLLYLRYSFRTMWTTRYPRHKLAADGTRFGTGQAVMTPKLGKAEACAWFRDMESLGLVENYDQFKTDLVVERNVGDPNRLDFSLSPDLINQLIVTAVKVPFLL